MRKLIAHKANALNYDITISVVDEPGAGGANHVYEIKHGGLQLGVIKFQNGPIKEHGVNGITQEALLAICIDRLEGFQRGEFACRENALALTKMQEAMHWLHHRTRDREARGVEGQTLA